MIGTKLFVLMTMGYLSGVGVTAYLLQKDQVVDRAQLIAGSVLWPLTLVLELMNSMGGHRER